MENNTINQNFKNEFIDYILKNGKEITIDENYYVQAKKQNRSNKYIKFMKSGLKKRYMITDILGPKLEFQGFNHLYPTLSTMNEINKFAIDFKRDESNIGKFVFGVPRFIHGMLQETPHWIVGEILDEDEWTFIIGEKSNKKAAHAFDKDAGIYSYFKILDTMEELGTMVQVFEEYLEEIWETLEHCEPYSNIGLQKFLNKNAEKDFVEKYFSEDSINLHFNFVG